MATSPQAPMCVGDKWPRLSPRRSDDARGRALLAESGQPRTVRLDLGGQPLDELERRAGPDALELARPLPQLRDADLPVDRGGQPRGRHRQHLAARYPELRARRLLAEHPAPGRQDERDPALLREGKIMPLLMI